MTTPRRTRKRDMLAYKVMESHQPHERPIGTVLLVREWLGQRYTFHNYDDANMRFGPTISVRYLGRITARTRREKVRQLLALPGTSHLRAARERVGC